MANTVRIVLFATLVALTCSANIGLVDQVEVDQVEIDPVEVDQVDQVDQVEAQKLQGIQRAMEVGCFNRSLLHGKQGLKDTGMRWPDKTVIFAWDFWSFWTPQQKNVILTGFKWIQDKTCVRFKLRTNERSYVLVHHQHAGCNAHMGFYNAGEQSLNLELNDANGSGCVHPGVAAHEMLHVLGVDHEQNRPDRDNYIKVHLENVAEDMKHNYFKNENTTTFNLPYDFDSIMHYPRNAFSMNGKDTMESIVPGRKVRDTVNYAFLTQKDIDLVNLMYNC